MAWSEWIVTNKRGPRWEAIVSTNGDENDCYVAIPSW